MSLITSNATQVLIVGAGPTGLMMACELARQGVRLRIVDKLATPSGYSKALGVQARTLELFQRLGLADRAVAAGLKIHGLRVHADRRPIARFSLDQIQSQFNFVLVLPQSKTEALLRDHLAELGVQVERPVELLNIRQTDDYTEATLVHLEDGRQETLQVPWLIGCDGAHSATRKLLGAAFAGRPFEESFALADAQADGELARDELSIYLSGGSILAFFPLNRDGLVRVVVEHPSSTDVAGEPSIAEFQSAVDSWGPQGVRLRDPIWMTRFRISQRQVSQYRFGHAFLAGDAAHIHSPLGGQGMNTGLQDAANLAWKLAAVLHGHAQPALLDTYQEERHPVGEMLLRTTGAFTRLMTSRNPLVGAVRAQLAPRILSVDFVADRVRAALSEVGLNYGGSSIVREENANSWEQLARPLLPGPRAGQRAPDAPLTTAAGATTSVFALFRPGRHTFFWFCGGLRDQRTQPAWSWLETKLLAEFRDQIDLYRVALASESPPAASSDTAAEVVGETLLDAFGAAHRIYHAENDTLFAVRPDGYIGYRSHPADAEKAAAWLRQILN
jgi:2-polyprenyl-6-methoxyphenol hydroxylase-like FAD-dependent oxidoreductase